jgi:hypothetical protein
MLYDQLEAGEIRLLKLPLRSAADNQHPVAAGEPIIDCELSHVLLKDGPNFEALSYVWGSDNKTEKIILNGEPFDVTPGLHQALSHMRLEDSPRMLWVDAVCINQANFEERGEQVQLMRDIYQTASSVAVFLGESWNGLDLAFGFFEAAAAHPDYHFDFSLEPCLTVQGHTAASRELRKNLIRLLTLPWWRRLWTAQEYVLARRVNFQCGDTILDGKIAQTAYDRLRSHENTCCWDCPVVSQDAEFGIPLLHAFFLMDATENARDSSGGHQVVGKNTWPATFSASIDENFKTPEGRWLSSRPLDFLGGLDLFRSRATSEDRDKIYGLTGLYYRDTVAQSFNKPDYNLLVESLFTDLVHTMVRITGKLEVLSRARGYCEPRYKTLPSFVPDWTVGYDISIDRSIRFLGYTATGDTKADWTVIDQATVRTKAILLDTITSLGSQTNPGSDMAETFQNWASLVGIKVTDKSFDEKDGIFSKDSPFWNAVCGNMVAYRIFGIKIMGIIDLEERKTEAEERVYNSYLAWYAYVTGMSSGAKTTEVIDFQSTFDIMTTKKRFAVTRHNRFGFLCGKPQEGDVIALLPGGGEPFILRLVSSATYEVVGVAYLHGIMQGEAFDESKLEDIFLV